jgi:hypothetical protein
MNTLRNAILGIIILLSSSIHTLVIEFGFDGMGITLKRREDAGNP